MSAETYAAVEQAIADHMADESEREAPIVTKWLVIAEIVSNTKEFQELTTINGGNLSVWDVAGMCSVIGHRCNHWFAGASDVPDEDD